MLTTALGFSSFGGSKWTPGRISNVKAWFRGDLGWASPNWSNLGITLTGVNTPTQTKPDTAANNQATINTSSAAGSYLHNDSVAVLTYPYTLVLIGATTNSGSNKIPLATQSGGTSGCIFVNSSNQWFLNAGTTLNSSVSATTFAMCFCEVNGGSSNIGINKTGLAGWTASGNAGTNSTGGKIGVGAQSSGASPPTTTKVGEILIVSGLISNANKALYRDYVNTFWNLGVT